MNPFLAVESQSSSDWEERANCKGHPVELFEYQEKDSPLCVDMTWKQRVAFNAHNFVKAEEVCIECPVFFECGANASTEDKYWTVRQGETPGRFNTEADHLSKVGRPTSKPGEPRTCKAGHFLPQGGRCMTCKREKNTIRQRAVRAAEKEAARKAADGVR